jgi:Nucleotidyl transferase AbiEii toxin, Type IV TA system
MTESYRMAASVRQRLKNLAGAADFQMTLLLYVLERLLYRLSQSDYRSQFVLKGALLFNLWSGLPSRATRDMDLLGFGESTPERITQIFRELCVLPVADDGLEFVADSVGSAGLSQIKSMKGSGLHSWLIWQELGLGWLCRLMWVLGMQLLRLR